MILVAALLRPSLSLSGKDFDGNLVWSILEAHKRKANSDLSGDALVYPQGS
jgi:hypothetical protein